MIFHHKNFHLEIVAVWWLQQYCRATRFGTVLCNCQGKCVCRSKSNLQLYGMAVKIFFIPTVSYLMPDQLTSTWWH